MGAALTKNQRWKEIACVGCPFSSPSPWGKSLNRMNIEFHLRPSNAMRAGDGSLSSRPIKKKIYIYIYIFGWKGSGEQSFFKNLGRARSVVLISSRETSSTRETLDTAQDNKGAFKNRRADRSRWPSVARVPTFVLDDSNFDLETKNPHDTEILINFPARFFLFFFIPLPPCPSIRSLNPVWSVSTVT